MQSGAANGRSRRGSASDYRCARGPRRDRTRRAPPAGDDELEFERDRAATLREEIDRLVLELDGPRLDEEVFARLRPEDVELVRAALPGRTGGRARAEDEWLELGASRRRRTRRLERDELEAEIARLEEEIAASNRRQEALRALPGGARTSSRAASRCVR